MPIIRQELVTFMDTHNTYFIRRHRKRAHHVAGVPNKLYRSPNYGFTVDQEVLNK
jgi:hypothetical protein